MFADEPRVPGVELEHRYADLEGVRLHYVEAGRGPLVVLLHGFPEFWYSWRFQLPALVEAGYRVVAPDGRGYNLSGKPRGVGSYRVEALARDVRDLVFHLGESRTALVGHDWGAAVAWVAAMRHPEVVGRLAVLNVPHPERFLRGLLSPEQLLRSWYVFALQAPGPPGRLVERLVFRWVRSGWRRDPARPGTFTESDIHHYTQAMSRPGALRCAADYYRALFRRNPLRIAREMRPVEAPTLVVWGERDRYLMPTLAEPDPAWVPDLRVVRLPEASHWVQQDSPEEVNEALLNFLGEDR
ncbi:putative hydrolases or acyltransferases (alpha/beta hydrolase superfamily) [Rubrobacter radiotolerans]|uniref:Alpha/beta hydrolase n=1 Tax=Rubrobacter radiotolerans TaxID=42256 RepID=A0A023X451_RUBRA|nr:alpha/beta hydrolase [Rubrobacter radiotolerans]AHY46976.1 putative hydrolases or acyltransferases (alpha/beta hydrolase superfamily) [Rubrobacter radiotolerans]MDX5894382.1 alpha/beta hydrolase [Rubrobacter radiotolerans]SMC05873.1 Pimeloyl-ACP methyl ester carboxylesterase [Rubrobacter radiotolerans DSM 5868]